MLFADYTRVCFHTCPMRRILIISALTAVACARQTEVSSGGVVAGTTTVARGTPTLIHTDTAPTPANQPSSGQPGEPATVRLDRTVYPRDTTLTMTVKNLSRDTLGFNACSSRELERKEQFATWVIFAEPNRVCTMELLLLSPGESQVVTTDIPGTVRAGTYRLVLTLMPQNSRGKSVRIVSSEFEVR